MSTALLGILPEIIITLTILFLLVWDLIRNHAFPARFTSISILGLALAFIATLWHPPTNALVLFSGALQLDQLTFFLRILSCVAGILTLLISHQSIELPKQDRSEFHALFLSVVLGMMVLAGSTDLITLYIAFELISIPSYLLAGFMKGNRASNEASLKYLLFGAVSSACLLYGFSLLFGITGTTYLPIIAQKLFEAPIETIHVLALIFILVGFGFKMSLVPFHMWTPDVYQGAPLPVTAFFSVGPKAAGAIALSRLLIGPLSMLHIEWLPILAGIAIVTMTLGNAVAIWQDDVKRMLAYSSIAHMGYLLIGLIAHHSPWGLQGIFIYLVAYLFMNFGAFAVAAAVQHETQSNRLMAFSGLSVRKPFLAFAMTVFMLSLTGIPPMAGFIGKFFLFAAAIDQGFLGLALVGVINSVISLYYYMNIVRYMYLQPPLSTARRDGADRPLPWGLRLGVLITLTGTLLLGLFPEYIAHLAATIKIVG